MPSGTSLFTLEDTVRPKGEKIFGKTAIHADKYRLKIRKEETPLTKRWRGKDNYPWFTFFIEVTGVENFQGIYFHAFNEVDETEGCIGTGKSPTFTNGDYQIKQSAVSMKLLYDELYDLIDNEENKVYLEIKEDWK